MNERIKNLLSQANIYDGRDSLYWCEEKNLTEFAKLIVRECMEVASPNYMSTPESGVYYVEQAINRIADHFGVEE